jgi:hypothetical protein
MSGAPEVVAADGTTAGTLHDGASEAAGHSPRPYLHPVLTPNGRTVSGYRPADHAWHWGLGIAVSTIEVTGQEHPVNLWGGPTYVRGEGYVQLPNNGSQREISRSLTGDGVVQRLSWQAADGEEFLTEERTWCTRTVTAGGVPWVCTTVRSSWANDTAGPLLFGSPTTSGRPGAGYGGFFLRLAAGFDDAVILVPGHSEPRGAAVTEESAAMGTVDPWMALRSEKATVLMLADAQDPSVSTPWFVRTSATPMLCAAPFFHETYELAARGAAEWSWSLLTADGAVADDAVRAAAGTART